MSDFATMLPGFTALVAQLAGLQIEKANGPAKMIDPRLKAKLETRVISCRPVSAVTDEIRYTYNETTGVNTMTSEGMRALTIQVKFEGFDHGPARDALFYLERIGDRIVLPSSLATLRALGMGLTNRGTFQDLSKVLSAEDREWSIGVKDFMLLAVVTTTPDAGVGVGSDNPANWVQSVTFVSTDMIPQISGTVTRP